MSKRLQVLLPDDEMAEIVTFAKRERKPVGQWVREALRHARQQQPTSSPDAKLAAIRKAADYSFPSGDIDQVLAEIERGYHS